MKKFTLLSFLLLMFVTLANAQTLNNPKDADGYYIVNWSCANNSWAAANDVEVDQTFVFAVDVTGTPFENWLKETPTAAGATRALAINKWTNFGDVSGGTNRLKQIQGNIYGATWNIKQMASTMNVASATGIDSVVYIYGQVFGFEFTADNPGAGWWMWPAEIAAGTAIDPGTGAIFRTLPYTGTKGSPEFYSDDYEGGLFFSNNTPEKGYTLPCPIVTGISNKIKSESPVVSHEYYNIQGVRLPKAPQSGLFIHKAIKADGSFVSTRELIISE
ncbi:MAG: hypothetical protein H6538_00805 [Bacteroidales bacterium]|nr:hypothetical protein [Bacteroidales bacterium]MCB9012581.1 hypothetical protein [Bacteroidales bacterium]